MYCTLQLSAEAASLNDHQLFALCTDPASVIPLDDDDDDEDAILLLSMFSLLLFYNVMTCSMSST